MKKLYCILILLVITLLYGCERYPDGPLFDFHKVETRLSGTWIIVGYTSNGVDSLQNFNDSCGCDMRIDFPQDWYDVNISFVVGGYPKFTGQFFFSNHKEIMNMMLNGSSYKSLGSIGEGGYSKWKILKLTMTDLKISTDFNNRNYLISFKKQPE